MTAFADMRFDREERLLNSAYDSTAAKDRLAITPTAGANMDAIVASHIKLTEKDREIILSCRVRTGCHDLPSSLWFSFPAEFASYIRANGDPFLPLLLIVAMKQRKRLVIEGNVSAMLLSSIPRIMDIYRNWSHESEEPLFPIEIDAFPVMLDRPGKTSAGFFSCGVDSFYTVLRNQSRYPCTDPRLITHLLLVLGFDFRLQDVQFFDKVREQAELLAPQLGKILVVVKTNARDLVPHRTWQLYAHGPAIAGVSHCLGGVFSTVYVASSNENFESVRDPWGSHPLVDHLWSTEQVEIMHDGGELSRADKIRALSNSVIALEFLRVCWGGEYNCGSCEKCLRTMLELRLCGALDRATRFPKKIEPELIEQLEIPPNDWKWKVWSDILSRLRIYGEEPEVVKAIEKMLARGVWVKSHLARLVGFIVSVVSPLGLTIVRIKAIDNRLLRGTGFAIFRRFRRWMAKVPELDIPS